MVCDFTTNSDFTKTSMHVSKHDKNLILKNDICYAKLSRKLIRRFVKERKLT